jgi:hypothetical protein
MIENTDRTMNLHHASLAIKESKGMLEAGRREGGGAQCYQMELRWRFEI